MLGYEVAITAYCIRRIYFIRKSRRFPYEAAKAKPREYFFEYNPSWFIFNNTEMKILFKHSTRTTHNIEYDTFP